MCKYPLSFEMFPKVLLVCIVFYSSVLHGIIMQMFTKEINIKYFNVSKIYGHLDFGCKVSFSAIFLDQSKISESFENYYFLN